MTTTASRSPDPPPYYDRCGQCGAKRTDPLAETCAACGEPYVLSNVPTTGHLAQAPCKFCGEPVYWITMRSGKRQPVNTKVIQIVTANGATIRGYVSHHATCARRRR